MGLSGIPTGTQGMPPNIPMPGGNDFDINDFCINYNDKFKNSGPTLFRDELVKQTLSVLIGKDKPNALLTGPPGTGKTKIVEDIAYRLANNDPLIPQQLLGYTIYELPLANLVAGSGLFGALEEKTQNIIDFASDKNNKAILFIDEIHVLYSHKSTYGNVAQMLKPALARGDIRIIGATTTNEASDLEKDPAFNRRLSRLIVDELTREQTVEILKHIKPHYINHYKKVSVDDDILELIAITADHQSRAGSHRPDNAITLLDRSLGNLIMRRKEQEAQAAAQNNTAVLKMLKSMPIVVLTEKDVKTTAMKLATGNATPNEFDIDKLKDALSVIKGQDDIIEQILKKIKSYNSPYYAKTLPLTLLFAGVSGVGKTEVTKILAKEITGCKPIMLNMAEYNNESSLHRIIGAPDGFVGSDSKHELPFDCLDANPYQIILLDEFEKSCKAVQRLFMSAFEEGYFKTSKGKIVDFSKAIVIATTNAGHKEIKNSLGFGEKSKTQSDSAEIKNLSAWFDTELLNRFEARYTFNEISKETYKEIVANVYASDIARIKSENRRVKLPDTIPDDDLNDIVNKTYIAAFGARPARKAVRQYIEDQIL